MNFIKHVEKGTSILCKKKNIITCLVDELSYEGSRMIIFSKLGRRIYLKFYRYDIHAHVNYT